MAAWSAGRSPETGQGRERGGRAGAVVLADEGHGEGHAFGGLTFGVAQARDGFFVEETRGREWFGGVGAAGEVAELEPCLAPARGEPETAGVFLQGAEGFVAVEQPQGVGGAQEFGVEFGELTGHGGAFEVALLWVERGFEQRDGFIIAAQEGEDLRGLLHTGAIPGAKAQGFAGGVEGFGVAVGGDEEPGAFPPRPRAVGGESVSFLPTGLGGVGVAEGGGDVSLEAEHVGAGFVGRALVEGGADAGTLEEPAQGEWTPAADDAVGVEKRGLGAVGGGGIGVGGETAACTEDENVRETVAAKVARQTASENQRRRAAGPIREQPVAFDGERMRGDVAALIVEGFEFRDGDGGDGVSRGVQVTENVAKDGPVANAGREAGTSPANVFPSRSLGTREVR